MFAQMRPGYECECLRQIEQQFNRMVDFFFDPQELARVPLRCGVRARENAEEVIVEIALPFEVSSGEIEVAVEGRLLVVRYHAAGKPRPRKFTLELWCDVDPDSARARGEGRVLRITLPKRAAKTLRIPIEKG